MASEENKVEGTDKPKPEPKKVDERAISLATQQETALAMSAQLEGEIEANKKLGVYARAGMAHAGTIRCYKASEDYSCEKRGVATSWSPARYDDAIGQITVRVRATNPEMFEDFDALKEKASSPSKSNERISTRLRVGIVHKHLVTLVGDKVSELPYRIVANYLISDRILAFSKQDVDGQLKPENAEFLKKQLGLLCDGKSSAASFLNGLKQHYADVEKEAADKAAANLTPAERALRESAAAEGKAAAAKQQDAGDVKKKLAVYLAKACTGMLSPDEIAGLIREAATKAKVSLPLGKMNPKNVTKEELSSFLEQVSMKGGKSPDERKAIRMVIVRVGSTLASQASNKKQQAANGKPQLAASAN